MAYIHAIKTYDPENALPTVEGRWVGGATTSLWFNGCSKMCRECHNAWMLDRQHQLAIPNYAVIEQTLAALDEFFPKHLALLGGDPLENSFSGDRLDWNNASDTLEIVSAIKQARPQTKVICWTGYTWSECQSDPLIRQMLSLLDVLVDGRYNHRLHVEGRLYGSANQRVIDVPTSLNTGKVVTFPW